MGLFGVGEIFFNVFKRSLFCSAMLHLIKNTVKTVIFLNMYMFAI